MEPYSLAQLDTFPQRGRGQYGMVVLTPRGAAKVSPYKHSLPGSRFSPFHCVNAEWLIQRALSDLPHVVPVYRSYVIAGAPLRTLRDDDTASHSRVVEMKDYPCRDLPRYFRNNPLRDDIHPDDLFRGILFQVAFTLQQIYVRFPNFRHNDLSSRNLLLEVQDTPAVYELPELGVRFRVPNVGYSVAIGDFDFACIGGVVDNYKALEIRAGFRAFTVGYEENHKADLFRFTNELYALLHEQISNRFREELERFFRGALNLDLVSNSYYGTESLLRRVPSVEDLLFKSGFYSHEPMPRTPPAPPTISLSEFTGERRVLPLLLSADFKRDFAAKTYFERIKPAEPLHWTSFILKYPREKVESLLGENAVDRRSVHKTLQHFFRTHLVPKWLLPLCVLHAQIDAHRKRAGVEKGHEYVRNEEMDVTEEQFIQFSLQWSWRLKK